MKLKIAFVGKLGSGKDTSANYFINKYGGIKLSFAEPLYDILHYAQEKCKFPIEKDRKFLQFVGTEWARSIDENIWIKMLLEKSKTINDNLYCSDVRFKNELLSLKEEGWICIKLNRNHVNKDRLGTGDKNHSSETEIDHLLDDLFDYIIDNNTTQEDLYLKLDLLNLRKTSPNH